MFSLLGYGGKTNGKKPERQNKRTLEPAELKTKSRQTPVKVSGNAEDRLRSRRHPERSEAQSKDPAV